MEPPDDNVTPLVPRPSGGADGASPPDGRRILIPRPPVAAEVAAANLDPESGDLARKEEAAVFAGLTRAQMAERAVRAEADRNEKFRDHFERLAIASLWMAAGTISIVGLIWLAHMVLPTGWRWLSTEDLSHIQSIVTAGLLVGLVGNHFKKRL